MSAASASAMTATAVAPHLTMRGSRRQNGTAAAAAMVGRSSLMVSAVRTGAISTGTGACGVSCTTRFGGN
jgi:hypothetical protein